MKNVFYSKTKLQIILICGVILLSFLLRKHDYQNIPHPGQSLDEYSYSWVGLSLIQLGYPVGNSGLPGYPFDDMRYINVDNIFQGIAEGDPFYINYPWFDHPPAMGLITGGFAYLKGARGFEDTEAALIRQPMIYLGTLCVGLVFVLTYIHFGYLTGLIASLIYGTIPLIIIQSRMIQAENGFMPFFLASLIFLSLYLKQQKIKWLFLSALLAGVCLLFKISGISAVITGCLILFFYNRNFKSRLNDISFFLIISLPFLSLFIIYGALYDFETFIKILSDNSTRLYGIGPAALKNLLIESRITQAKTFSDGWPLVLWIGFLIFLFKEKIKNNLFFPIAIISYLLVYLFFGSWPYGWYVIPFLPFLVIIFSKLLVETSKNSNYLFGSVYLLLFPSIHFLNKLLDFEKFQGYASFWRMGITGLIIVLFWLSFTEFKRKAEISLAVTIFFLIISVLVNLYYFSTINVDSWYKIN